MILLPGVTAPGEYVLPPVTPPPVDQGPPPDGTDDDYSRHRSRYKWSTRYEG